MKYSARHIPRIPYICSSCLSKRSRRLHNTARLRSATTAPPAPPSSAFAHVSNRSLVLLSGHDAPKFLQGLTTNNVDSSRTKPWYSGFLSAQGRVLWDSIIYPWDYRDGEMKYLIEVDREEVGPFMKHLKRHKLRSKVQVRDVGEEWTVWSAWGAKSQESATNDNEIATVDPRLPSLGDRILLSASCSSPLHLQPYKSLTETSLDEYKIRRYLHGIAEGQQEILRESALPMESNMDYLNGIDFRKGCYVGQELTIRTQHTGVIRKRILPVQLYSADSPAPSELSYAPKERLDVAPGTDIKAEGGRRPAGKFLASVGNIGLALCRLENMTDLRVSAEGGTYKEGTEFAVTTAEGDKKVKIKAFVPEWLRTREEEKLERRKRREEDHAVE